MLEGVIIHGTGKRARIGGYSAAGKTGTARKVDVETGRYSKSRYVASFVGMAPVKNPQVVCLVSIDEPKGRYFGGDVAAPVFSKVVADALQVLGVEPEDQVQTNLLASASTLYDIPRWLMDESPEVATEVVVSSEPVAASIGVSATQPPASSQSVARRPQSIIVPELTGRSLREAVSLCAGSGLKISATGDGLVFYQTPQAGAATEPGTVCIIELSRNQQWKERSVAVVRPPASKHRAEKQ
jgi:stage V sporulation protein D (sporulation-specific penicillin-binding protein)